MPIFLLLSGAYRFAAEFDYAVDDDEGLLCVETLTATYGLPDSYLKIFHSRRVAAKAAP